MYNTAHRFIPRARYRVGLSREVLRTLILESTGSNWGCPDTAMVMVVRHACIRQ